MISVDLALLLRNAGLRWRPASGDRFAMLQPEMDGEIFTISEMTIEAHTFPTGTVLGFNGTTEWALDSVTLDTALWLPREDQLRDMLGDRFAGLHRDAEDWLVQVDGEGGRDTFSHPDPECAYALALLSLV